MRNGLRRFFSLNGKKDRGYTLLEYAVGAAVLVGIIVAGLNAMGSGVVNLFNGIGEWASGQVGGIGNYGG